MSPAWTSALAVLLAAPAAAQIDRDLDLAAVRLALEQGAQRLPGLERTWEEGLRPSDAQDRAWAELFGYAPPGHALNLARALRRRRPSSWRRYVVRCSGCDPPLM